jgi:hypothetical protein
LSFTEVAVGVEIINNPVFDWVVIEEYNEIDDVSIIAKSKTGLLTLRR